MFTNRPAIIAGIAASIAAPLSHAAITLVDYSTVVATTTEDFSGFASGGNTPYNGLVQGNGLAFGERFAGQQLSSQTVSFPTSSNQFDALSGSPTSPLTLLAGSANHNLWIGDLGLSGGFMMAGCGPAGSAFGNGGGAGHGSVALLFDEDQSQLGFRILGQNGSIGVVSFFRRDGSLIETVNINLPNLQTGGFPEVSFGFLRDGGVADIAGMSFTNVDWGGVGMDNFIFSNSIPAPGAVTLLGLAGLVGGRRRRA